MQTIPKKFKMEPTLVVHPNLPAFAMIKEKAFKAAAQKLVLARAT